MPALKRCKKTRHGTETIRLRALPVALLAFAWHVVIWHLACNLRAILLQFCASCCLVGCGAWGAPGRLDGLLGVRGLCRPEDTGGAWWLLGAIGGCWVRLGARVGCWVCQERCRQAAVQYGAVCCRAAPRLMPCFVAAAFVAGRMRCSCAALGLRRALCGAARCTRVGYGQPGGYWEVLVVRVGWGVGDLRGPWGTATKQARCRGACVLSDGAPRRVLHLRTAHVGRIGRLLAFVCCELNPWDGCRHWGVSQGELGWLLTEGGRGAGHGAFWVQGYVLEGTSTN